MKRLVGLTGAGLLLMGMAVLAQGNQKLADAGKKIYDEKKCADCHTIGSRGGRLTKQFPMDDVGKRPAAEMRMWLTNPLEMEAKSEKKPKLKLSSKKYKFTDAEVDALIAYMQTLVKK